MAYVDGFVIVVPKRKVKAYALMARAGCKVWMEHGALQYFECAGDDLKCEWGLPFPKLTKAKANETVYFSFIVYKSRAHRDSVNKKVMKDKRMEKFMKMPMPFDVKKMAYGGFKTVVNA